jgi:hypothetical protein
MTTIFKLVLTSVVLATAAISSLAQGEKANTQKDNHAGSQDLYFNADAREVLQPTALAADKVSATSIGNVLTLLFDSAKLSVQTESDPLTATWVTTIAVPTKATGQKLTSYLQHVRGAVMKTESSRVSLVLSLGGKTFVKEYPYGTKSSGDVLLKYVSPIQPRPAGRYIATILILVERRDAKSAVLVNVDSLDVAARTALKSKKK